MKTPKFDLLIEARAVLAGIPAHKYITDLQTFFDVPDGRKKPNPAHCDTFACGAGWLSMYPPFQRSKANPRGLFLKVHPFFKGCEIRCGMYPNHTGSFLALENFLSLERPLVEYLFDTRRNKVEGPHLEERLIDKDSSYDLGAVGKALARFVVDPEHMEAKQIILRRFDKLLAAFSNNGYKQQVMNAAFDVAARLAARNIRAERAA